MAESSPPTEQLEPGAPVPKDAPPDPELVKLRRKPLTVGVITSAGIVFLCIVFLLRLGGDRTFSGEGEPRPVTVQDVVAGRVGADSYVTLTGEPLRAHALRAARSKTGIGFRVAPVRGASEKLWVMISGDGWDPPTQGTYTGRLRKLSDLVFADAIRDYARAHPRPLFATVADVKAGLGSGDVKTVAGDTVKVAAGDRVAYDVVEPGAALIVAAANDRFPNAKAWSIALAAAGVTVGEPLPPPIGQSEQIRFEVKMPDAQVAVTEKLKAANLWAARVEPIVSHHETTWAQLGSAMPATGVDLIGLYVAKDVPDGAVVLITGEKPQDYWYILPITIALAVTLLVFAWALVRAVRRDVLPPRAS